MHSIIDVRSNSNAVKDDFIYDKHEKDYNLSQPISSYQECINDGVNLDDGSKKVSKTRIPLKDTKESYPVDVVEFAVASGVNKMHVFT